MRLAFRPLLLAALALALSCSGGGDHDTTEVAQATAPPAPEVLQLPASPIMAATTVGYLPASWEVTPHGNFTYTIPLDVPQGRAGMQPSLALAYSSAGGNGVVGMGWSLVGWSEITRCGRTLFTEGFVDGADYDHAGEPDPEEKPDTRDRLCLDGAKLVPLVGEQGEPGTEYRTEHESYAKIVGDGDSLGFTVWTKAGRIRRYAPIWFMRWAYEGGGRVPRGFVEERWALVEDADRLGNAIRYEHAVLDDGEGGHQVVLSAIEYTRFGSEGGKRRVEFAYEDRRDHEFAWRSGVRMSLVKRLSSITMLAPAPAATQPVWVYRLSYSASETTDRSLLASVAKCGILPDGTQTGCTWSKRFEWYGTGGLQFTAKDITTVPVTTSATAKHPSLLHTLDVDGNGADDVLFQPGADSGDADVRLLTAHVANGVVDPLATQWFASNNGGTFTADIDLGAARPVDVDGDGTSEVFLHHLVDGTNVTCQRRIVHWSADRFDDTVTWPEAVCVPHDDMFLDLDGDGRLDYFEGTDKWRAHRNEGGSFATIPTSDYEIEDRAVYGSDVDGDGRAELLAHAYSPEAAMVRFDDSGVFGYESGGIDLPRPCTYDRKRRPMVFADVNGDGLHDAIDFCEREGETPSLQLAWNSGNGFSPPIVLSIAGAGIESGSAFTKVRTGDVDRDGRADLVVLSAKPSSQITVLRSRGDGTFTAVSLVGTAGQFLEIEGAIDPFPTTKLGDFNADGHLDLARVNVDGNGNGTLQLALQQPHFVDRMLAVSDGNTVWRRETIQYATRWSDKPEARAACTYPLRCIARGLTVVRSVESLAHVIDEAPAGKARTLHYSYEDPVADLRGRGFLGFGKVRIWDPSRPMETILTFDHRTLPSGRRWAFAGRPTKVQTVIALEPFAEIPSKGFTTTKARVTSAGYDRELVGATSASIDDRPTGWSAIEWEQEIQIDWGTIDPAPANWTSDHMFGVVTPSFGEWERWRLGTTSYDDYGNVLTRMESTANSQTVEETFQYLFYDKDAWLIARPARHCTTAHGGGTSVSRCEDITIDDSLLLQKVKRDTTSDADPQQLSILSYSYDSYGAPTGVTRTSSNAAGVLIKRETFYEYAPIWPGQPDEHIFPSQVWRMSAHKPSTWIAIHPAYGVASAWMDSNGVQGSARYDALGRIRSRSVDGEPTVTTSYVGKLDSFGGQNGVVTTRTANGVDSKVATDALGREVLTTTAGFDGTAVNVARRYDRLGRPISESRPYGAAPTYGTTYAYDPLDRVLAVTHPDATQTTYEHSFHESRTRDAANHESSVLRDPDGRIVESTSYLGATPLTTTYRYAPLGHVDRVTDPDGNVVETEVDRWGRVVRKHDPTLGTYELSYNGFDELLDQRHLETGEVTTYHFDNLGRTTSIDAPDGTTTLQWDAQPNGKDRLAWATSPSGVTTRMHYDTLGRTVGYDQVVDGLTYPMRWSWNANHRVHEITYPPAGPYPGLVLRHEYNAAGHLRELRDMTTATSVWRVDGRNVDDSLTAGQLGNGFTVERAYTPHLGRPWTMRVKQGATNVFDVGYAYHPDGLVRRRADAVTGLVEDFEYDALDRLTRWDLVGSTSTTQTEYEYDAVGNLERVLRNGTVIEQNAYGPTGSTTPYALLTQTKGVTTTAYSYDLHGRQTSGGGRTLSQFTSAHLPRRMEQGGVVTDLLYDAFGERAVKRTSTQSTLYLGKLYERREGAGRVTHVYRVYTEDGAIAEVGVSPTGVRSTSYFATDALGTVSATIEPAGTITRAFFDPWGSRAMPFGTTGNRLGFTAHEHDDEVGLVQMRGRLYDPKLRRMLSPDPHVAAPFFGQSWNAYSYVWNSPTNRVDITGYDPSGMYYDCTYFVDGCGDGLDDLVTDPVGGTGSLFENSVGYGTGQLGWASQGLGGEGGIVQSTLDGYSELGASPSDSALHDTHTGPTGAGPVDVPCGNAPAPKCGTAADRRNNRTEMERKVDDLVKTFGSLPAPGAGGKTIDDMLMHGDEYTAGIIIDSNGVPRFTAVFKGTHDKSQVPDEEWRRALKSGDRVVGTVHSHPKLSAEHFSDDDLNTAKDSDVNNKDALHPQVGTQFYLLYAKSNGSGGHTGEYKVFSLKGETGKPKGDKRGSVSPLP